MIEYKPVEFPPIGQFITIYYKKGEEIKCRVGHWTGRIFCYITPPSHGTMTSFEIEHVVGWDRIKDCEYKN